MSQSGQSLETKGNQPFLARSRSGKYLHPVEEQKRFERRASRHGGTIPSKVSRVKTGYNLPKNISEGYLKSIFFSRQRNRIKDAMVTKLLSTFDEACSRRGLKLESNLYIFKYIINLSYDKYL